MSGGISTRVILIRDGEPITSMRGLVVATADRVRRHVHVQTDSGLHALSAVLTIEEAKDFCLLLNAAIDEAGTFPPSRHNEEAS